MDFEIKLRFMNCLLCDVNFCPVALIAHSEDEKLLDIFCKYFDLSPKEMESFYDEQVGFPFCDTCRGETLLNLSDLHDKFTSIQKDISKLVTSVSLEIVNIMNRNNDEDDENTQSQLLSGIRKNISARYKPNVVLMDFYTLFNKRKKPSTLNNKNNHDNNLLCQKYLEREENDYNFDIKHEAWTPMFNPEDSNDEREAERDFPSTTSSAFQPPPRKRRKQEFHTISNVENPLNHNKEIPKIIYVHDFNAKKKVNNNNSSSNKKPKTAPPPKKVQGKNEGVKKEKRATITKFKEDESDYVSEEDEAEPEENEPISEYELDEDENEDSFTDSDDSSPPLLENPKPKKTRKRRSLVFSSKYDKRVHDPLEEVEPGLFKRKRSGWSFRKEKNDEGEDIYRCLAEECDKTLPTYTYMAHHISFVHVFEWLKCNQCWRRFHNQKHLDQHALKCKPPVRVYKNINQGGGDWIYADDGVNWPYHEVDKLTNRGFSMKCGTCGKLERDKNKMSSHIILKHVGPNRFVCDACGFSCPNNSQLKNHQLRHQSEKHFICELCGLKCKSPTGLRSHLLRHEKGKKSYKCDFPDCRRAFSASSALNRHRKSAGHPKPINPEPTLPVEITCPKCQRNYVNQQTFERHSRDCKGKQRVPCPLCDKTSVNKSALRSHMRFLHPMEFEGLKSQLYSHPSRIRIRKISTRDSQAMEEEEQVEENVAEQLN